MADIKKMITEVTRKAVKLQTIDKAAAERVARSIQAAKETAKIPIGKKA